MEVKINHQWLTIDNYINDLDFHQSGVRKLKSKGIDTGYSVSCARGDSSPNLDIKEIGMCR